MTAKDGYVPTEAFGPIGKRVYVTHEWAHPEHPSNPMTKCGLELPWVKHITSLPATGVAACAKCDQ